MPAILHYHPDVLGDEVYTYDETLTLDPKELREAKERIEALELIIAKYKSVLAAHKLPPCCEQRCEHCVMDI